MFNMNINFKFLLCGAAFCFVPQAAVAQCAVTDCQQLGYTSLKSCDGGLKCPFGEYWACPCDEAYKYTCAGSNEQPGTDKCGEKYKSCTCASGYEWKDGTCEKIRPKCKIGWYYYSNNTCNEDIIAGREIIGVVFYLNPDGIGGQALAMQYAGRDYWSDEDVDIPGLENKACVEQPGYRPTLDCSKATNDVSSCANTKLITESCAESACKAAWLAKNYVPSNAPETKGKWCLPAGGIARSMMNNYDKINSGLSKAGGELLPEPIVHNYWYWSSSEYDNYYAWVFRTKFGGADYGGVAYDTKDRMAYVRPVLAF